MTEMEKQESKKPGMTLNLKNGIKAMGRHFTVDLQPSEKVTEIFSVFSTLVSNQI